MTQKEYFRQRLYNIEYRIGKRISEVRDYLVSNNIKSVVFGLSGGRDSLLVFLILSLIKRDMIKDLKIYPITFQYQVPYKFDSFNIKDVEYLEQYKSFLDFSNHKVVLLNRKDLNKFPKELLPSNKDKLKEIAHQSNYQYMYHMLFNIAQMKQAITIGTTNLDELSYIGWFGKNSDMVVDLQIISDFHKFEINHILDMYNLNVLSEPKGDLFSSQTDEEVFNTNYDIVAYYSYCKCNNIEIEPNLYLDILHETNKHKYYGQTFNPYFIKNDNYFFIHKEKL